MRNIIIKSKITILFISLVIVAFLGSSCCPYSINEGYDFSTGEKITALFKESDKKPTWVNRYSGEYRTFYIKYQLEHSAPILLFYCSRYYTRFGVARQIGCGDSPYFVFFKILRKFTPPKPEVKEIFNHCIKMYNRKADIKEIEAYLRKHYIHYNDPGMKRMLLAILADPKIRENLRNFEHNQHDLLDYLLRHRKEYPKRLDPGLLDLFQKYYTANFFIHEYLYHPSENNAVRLAMLLTKKEGHMNFNMISKAFKELNKAKLLESFLSITIPPVMPKLPAPVSPFKPHKTNQPTNLTFKDTPKRQQAIQFMVYPSIIRSHLKKCQIIKEQSR